MKRLTRLNDQKTHKNLPDNRRKPFSLFVAKASRPRRRSPRLKLLKVGKFQTDITATSIHSPATKNGGIGTVRRSDFLRGYISIEYSGNMVVVKTYSGHSDVVAGAIDSMNLEEVLDNFRRDNCVFICLRQGVSGEDFLDTLK